MKKINAHALPEEPWVSPRGMFASFSRELSVALGRRPDSTDLMERQPFDVELCRVPPGARMCPYHSHSAQWEFYLIQSGRGTVRDAEGLHTVEAGDAFLFRPNQPHQLINDGTEDLIYLVIADNPLGDSCHYPDSGKWLVRGPERHILGGASDVPYWQGEEE